MWSVVVLAYNVFFALQNYQAVCYGTNAFIHTPDMGCEQDVDNSLITSMRVVIDAAMPAMERYVKQNLRPQLFCGRRFLYYKT